MRLDLVKLIVLITPRKWHWMSMQRAVSGCERKDHCEKRCFIVWKFFENSVPIFSTEINVTTVRLTNI